VDITPEGAEAISTSGHYMTVFSRQADGWKIQALITNYDAVPSEGFPTADSEVEPPTEEGTMTDLVAAYVEHFNAGHAAMVAGLYAEDGVSAFSNLALAEGRAAIEAALGERLAMGSPQLAIHDVGTWDLGDGWAIDGGWYEINATSEEGDVTQIGNYMLLCQQQEDGSWAIQWAVSNGLPN
jgi:ketosteroid isomerase-like protein